MFTFFIDSPAWLSFLRTDFVKIHQMKIAYYITQLERVFHGGNWVQESFAGKLKDLDDERVFFQPYPRVHSVAELVSHCAYWRTVTLSRLRGEQNSYRDATFALQNFPDINELKAKGWLSIRQSLEETQIELVNFLKDKDDSFLANEYEPGLTYEFVVEGTIQHDYYHLGQIGLVMKIFRETR
jgi:uncharacterized damage-inducible protein DinB